MAVSTAALQAYHNQVLEKDQQLQQFKNNIRQLEKQVKSLTAELKDSEKQRQKYYDYWMEQEEATEAAAHERNLIQDECDDLREQLRNCQQQLSVKGYFKTVSPSTAALAAAIRRPRHRSRSRTRRNWRRR